MASSKALVFLALSLGYLPGHATGTPCGSLQVCDNVTARSLLQRTSGQRKMYVAGSDVVTQDLGWQVVFTEEAGTANGKSYDESPDRTLDFPQWKAAVENRSYAIKLQWPTGWVSFVVPNGYNIFKQIGDPNIPIQNITTSSDYLPDLGSTGWFCHACVAGGFRWGDTCWGVLPLDNNYRQCGCSSGDATGTGIFYGGMKIQNICHGRGGGFAGPKVSGEQRGDLDSIGLTFSINLMPEGVPVDCAFTWGNWSSCSASCGGGMQTRIPLIITDPALGGVVCPQPQTQPCNLQPCQEATTTSTTTTCAAVPGTVSSVTGCSKWKATYGFDAVGISVPAANGYTICDGTFVQTSSSCPTITLANGYTGPSSVWSRWSESLSKVPNSYVNTVSGFVMFFDYYGGANTWVITNKATACYDEPAMQLGNVEFYYTSDWPNSPSATPGSAPVGWTWGSVVNGQWRSNYDYMKIMQVSDQASATSCSQAPATTTSTTTTTTTTTTISSAQCTVPTTAGYNFGSAGGIVSISGFAPTGVTCASGYVGSVSYSVCSASSSPYSVSGCQSQSCGMIRGMTVYTGCGYTYVMQSDRNAQCGSGGTSQLIIDSFNGGSSCGMTRGMTVYTGCGYTYLSQSDRNAQCGSGGTSQIIFDSWVPPQAQCTVPTTPGYNFGSAGGIVSISGFAPTGVICASGYVGTVSYSVCSASGSPYSVSGCQSQSCGMTRGMTVYTGCGYTYVMQSDRNAQCGSGGTSQLIIDSFNGGSSCGMTRGMTVYTGCGYTYLSQNDRNAQCGSGGTSQIIFDSWVPPQQ